MRLEIFSKRLKELMELEGCSIRALSNKIGSDRKSIRLWLSGAFYPKSEGMIKLSIYFKVSIDYLVGLENVLKEENFFESRKFPSIEIIQKQFSQNLSIFIKENDLTLYAIAKRLQIDQKALAKWFTNGSMPEVATLVKLASLTNMTINELLGII